MGTRDHYISRFFLAGFCDPDIDPRAKPWLWVGSLADASVKRRAPQNVAWSRNLFAGPGGLEDREKRLEDYLAQQVEGPAAEALRSFLAAPIGAAKEIPPQVGRYVAWLAARSLAMKTLYASWLHALGPLDETTVVEPPPPGLLEAQSAPPRSYTMDHPVHGVRTDVSDQEIEPLRLAGWRWQLSTQDFLEMVHVQAWYFQVRFFPRLSWKVLDAPQGSEFVTGDRPVAWGVEGEWDVPPAALRHPRAELIAPLSRSRALFGHNALHDRLGPVAPERVNATMAAAAHSWIAGSSEATVTTVLRERLSATN